MKIELNIKGTVTELNPGKDAVSSYLSSHGYGTMFGKHVDCARKVDGDIMVYHAEKHRRKVEVLDKPIKMTKKQLQNAYHVPHDGLIKRKIIKQAHWKVTTYLIPYKLLEMANIKVVQQARTFKLVKIK